MKRKRLGLHKTLGLDLPPPTTGYVSTFESIAALCTSGALCVSPGLWLALLSTTIISRNVTIANVDKLHPVLWVLLVAPSNSGKSRSYDFMMDVFEATGLYQEIIPINSFSPEGLIEAVSESPRKAAWLVPDEAGVSSDPCDPGTT